MAGKVIHAAIVGASTLLGKELLSELSESAAAAWDLKLLEEGEDVEGQLTAAGDEALVIHALNDASFRGVDIVLFAGSPELARTYSKPALTAGALVVDLSGGLRGHEGFVVRSPWIEASQRPDLTTTGVSVPHPAALMLALVAERLGRLLGKVQLIATVLEPASQAGASGVDELHQQTVNLLSFHEMPKAVFDTQIAFNVQAEFGEEAKTKLGATSSRIRQDIRSLLGAELGSGVSLSLLQAPVFHGYVMSVHVSAGTEAQQERVRAALSGGIITAAEDTVPSNQNAAEAGTVLASVEADEDVPGSLWLVLAADNLRLAARSAVVSALELAAFRPAARVQ